MSEAARLNAVLEAEAPALARCLSPLGRRIAFPQGIPFQSAAARGTEINATIGQVTDGRNQPLPLPSMAELCDDVDAKMAFLYSPQQGHKPVRDAWRARQVGLSEGSSAPYSLPVVTNGLTQAVSLTADLFVDEDTDVVVPVPHWENYELLFTLRQGARLVPWNFFDGDRLNVQGLADALAQVRRKAVIVLNFPSNPTGYTPTPQEAAEIVRIVTAHQGPAVALVDDAYQGMIWEDGLMSRSIYWDLAEAADPERLFVVKVDGTTKELFFFGGRIGFLGHSATGEAETALLSKIKAIGRGTISVPAGPSQALVLQALRSPTLDQQLEERLGLLRSRYIAFREAVGGLEGTSLRAFPFNSGVFALVGVGGGQDADTVRRRLIEEQSVGTICIPEINALRVAYCSTRAEDLPELVDRMRKVVG